MVMVWDKKQKQKRQKKKESLDANEAMQWRLDRIDILRKGRPSHDWGVEGVIYR